MSASLSHSEDGNPPRGCNQLLPLAYLQFGHYRKYFFSPSKTHSTWVSLLKRTHPRSLGDHQTKTANLLLLDDLDQV